MAKEKITRRLAAILAAVDFSSYRRPEDVERLREGLGKAGLTQ